MTRYSFTGTAHVPTVERHAERITALVLALADGDEFTTGAQFGIDVFVMAAALLAFPEALHRIVVPAAPHDTEAVEWAYENGVRIVHAPYGRTAAEAYRNRNRLMVESHADVLQAIPRLDERRQPYSGTWATVRLAHKARIPVVTNILEPQGRTLEIVKGT